MRGDQDAKAIALRLFLAILLCGVTACATEPVEKPPAFAQCAACHTTATQPGRHRIGPSLSGIVGSKAGTQEGYFYSDAMKRSGIIWNEDTLRSYLENPKKAVPGNKMAFAGLRRPEDIQAVIAYLKSPAPDRPIMDGPPPRVGQLSQPTPLPNPAAIPRIASAVGASPSNLPQETQRVYDFLDLFKASFPKERFNGGDLQNIGNFFGEMFARIRSEHVTPIDDEAAISAARSALADRPTGIEPRAAMVRAVERMVEALGSGSKYLPVGSLERTLKMQGRDIHSGIGVELKLEGGMVVIQSAFEDMPADKAGLRQGDRIVTIEDQPTRGLDLLDVIDRLKGALGSEVALLVDSPNQAPRHMRLVRAKIQIKTVKAHRDGNIGYMQLSKFTSTTGTELKKATGRLKLEAGGPLKGYILDLRHNTGGLLDQTVAVADYFLDQGLITVIRGRRVEDTQTFRAHAGDLAEGAPLAVLIDGQTAAGAEIVAAALRDNDRATLVGTRSFGRGIIQTLIPQAGFGSLSLTTAKFYTPSERSIHGIGITPDTVVAWDYPSDEDERKRLIGQRGTDLQYARAIAILADLSVAGRPKLNQ